MSFNDTMLVPKFMIINALASVAYFKDRSHEYLSLKNAEVAALANETLMLSSDVNF